jgi:hypothetical protein
VAAVEAAAGVDVPQAQRALTALMRANVICRLSDQKHPIAPRATPIMWFFYLQLVGCASALSSWRSRVSVTVGGDSECGGVSRRRRWRRAVRGLATEEVRDRARVRVRGLGFGVRGFGAAGVHLHCR